MLTFFLTNSQINSLFDFRYNFIVLKLSFNSYSSIIEFRIFDFYYYQSFSFKFNIKLPFLFSIYTLFNNSTVISIICINFVLYISKICIVIISFLSINFFIYSISLCSQYSFLSIYYLFT